MSEPVEITVAKMQIEALKLEQRGLLDIQTVKGLLLINGGGCIALLGLFSAILGKAYYSLQNAILISVVLMVAGIIAAMLNNHFMRLCSLAWSSGYQKWKILPWQKPEPTICHWCHGLRYASMLLFLVAVLYVTWHGYNMRWGAT